MQGKLRVLIVIAMIVLLAVIFLRPVRPLEKGEVGTSGGLEYEIAALEPFPMTLIPKGGSAVECALLIVVVSLRGAAEDATESKVSRIAEKICERAYRNSVPKTKGKGEQEPGGIKVCCQLMTEELKQCKGALEKGDREEFAELSKATPAFGLLISISGGRGKWDYYSLDKLLEAGLPLGARKTRTDFEELIDSIETASRKKGR